jgi:hypothetical protein
LNERVESPTYIPKVPVNEVNEYFIDIPILSVTAKDNALDNVYVTG